MNLETEFHRELSRFEPARPIGEASCPPATWYSRQDFYEAERRRVLGAHWQPVARLDQLKEPGDFVSGMFMGWPWVVNRDAGGKLRAFRNVCRHRATCVVSGSGNAKEFVCGYHGWTYDLDGRLRRAPELGGHKGFKRQDYGLMELPVEGWGPFAWMAFTRDPPALGEQLAPLSARLDAMHWSSLTFVHSASYRIKCNWKVFVDNYLDGGYHVAHLHKGLGAQLDLSSYRSEVEGIYSIQSCGGGTGTSAPGADFQERIGGAALYAWIHPAFMLNRYGPYMDTNRVFPISVDETEVIFDYFADSKGQEPGFLEKSLNASHVVQQEDIDICESVQRGLSSGFYDRGPYAVNRETPQLHFHRLLAADLARDV